MVSFSVIPIRSRTITSCRPPSRRVRVRWVNVVWFVFETRGATRSNGMVSGPMLILFGTRSTNRRDNVWVFNGNTTENSGCHSKISMPNSTWWKSVISVPTPTTVREREKGREIDNDRLLRRIRFDQWSCSTSLACLVGTRLVAGRRE